jgi:hypothetical protein
MKIIKISNSYGKCLRFSLEDIKNNPDRKLMMGKGYRDNTAHFWTEDCDGKIYDRIKHSVPKDYDYIGREVNVKSVIKELKEKGFDLKS